jgi:hypothetical protein
VYDYTLAKAGKNPPDYISDLDPSGAAIEYRYPSSGIRSYGALALCRLIHRTADEHARSLHRLSIKPPDKRFLILERVVQRYFTKAKLNGTVVVVSKEPKQVSPRVFPIPELDFGGGHVLKVAKGGGSGGVPLAELGRARMQKLLDPGIGSLVVNGFDRQHLIAPLGLRREIVEDFKKCFEDTIQRFSQCTFRLESILYDDSSAVTLKQQVDAIVEAVRKARIDRGHAVLVLPPSPRAGLHNYTKKKLLELGIQCQCVLADSLEAFYEPRVLNGKPSWSVRRAKQGRYASYLRYAALGHLIVNRKWPWALKTPLNYDVHIGLDVLHNTAVFVSLYDNGKRCIIRHDDSRQKEKLLAKQVQTRLYESLREDLAACERPPRSIVILRDGRTYGCEWKGFVAAVEGLKAAGVAGKPLLSQQTTLGIVEVHKTSAVGVRLVVEKNGKLVNPDVGSWQPLGEREGIVCTTGYPFKSPGTVRPLHVRIAYGDLDLEKVLQDVFDLSQLCWMVPDRCIRLPIPVKLGDDFLRPVAADVDENAAEYGVEPEDGGKTALVSRSTAIGR